MLQFSIRTQPDKYFHQLIEILGVFYPFNKLRKRERDVFGEILYQLHLILEDGGREKDVFDYKIKEHIAEKVGISKANLYNIYKELREHNLLTKEGINKEYKFKYLEHDKIIFRFKRGDAEKDLQRNVNGTSSSHAETPGYVENVDR